MSAGLLRSWGCELALLGASASRRMPGLARDWNATCCGGRMNKPALRPEELRNPREVWNARDYGLAGDGQTNDQPALQELVDELGRPCRAGGLPRVVYCPPGAYRIAGRTTAWRSGVS